jgi:DNA-binding HxlR family transcriptional regulator
MLKKQQKLKPLKKVLLFLNNRYKFEIIYYLSLQKMRFGEIKDSLESITQQLLTKQLKEMEKDNLIIRKNYNQFPKKVEYSLSVFGDSLVPLVKSMNKWEKTNIKKINTIMKKRLLNSIFDYY